ncbi:ribosome maturation factor RimP [Clostridium isatidis]|uniref:Ribosome maturation factor RimP n=1 Tax=Clostridium isatidis TaxID=182773 RepID=A0A343JBL2_9CLOT|nr:ribosome maturation factor RimP [Clostridium isatidis]ASW42920.1 ribosome maturation factor RimP [Clostridium isatidis]NLZ35388.1 ribosome maturation factor RimP [Clostridiales bacterium]
MKVDLLVKEINQYARPIAEELNLEIYYIEYVKEDGSYYLRIYIDKEGGGITLSDCEAMSRRISDILDEKDPIPEAYYLEVSSPGLNRRLYIDEHYRKQIGKEIQVKLSKGLDGKKIFKGILKEVKDISIILEEAGEEIEIPKDKIKSANLEGEI